MKNHNTAMSKMIRFGTSLPRGLIDKFDRLIEGRGYSNRSEAIRDLIRQELVREQWSGDGEVAGAVTLIYDHHRRDLVKRLMDLQHDHERLIVCTQHIHLDHDNCLEIIAVRGKAKEAQKLSDALKAVKGVKHGSLGMTGTGKNME